MESLIEALFFTTPQNKKQGQSGFGGQNVDQSKCHPTLIQGKNQHAREKYAYLSLCFDPILHDMGQNCLG